MSAIDTHVHIWDAEAQRHPWIAEMPLLNRSFSLADYREAAKGIGGACMLVEANAAPEDGAKEARFLNSQCEADPDFARGFIAGLYPESASFPANLDEASRLPFMRGVRRVLHTHSDDVSKTELFRRHVALLGARDLLFEICVLERQLPLAIDLVDACPDTMFVLDHCGVPDIAADRMSFWRAKIGELAWRPNVVCKLSGLMLYARPEQRTVDGVLPWFAHVLGSFGPGRVCWGSDWPLCAQAAEVGNWAELTRALASAAGLSQDETAALFGGNARRIYKL